MRSSIVKQKWRSGRPALCTSACILHPTVPELIGLAGFDCAWIDFEHQPGSIATAAEMVRACRAVDVDCMLRPPRGSLEEARRMLEVGATGILYPRVESVQEVRQVVEALRFPPQGRRGFGGASTDVDYGMDMDPDQVLARCNDQTFVLIQIETREALECCAEIAAVEHIDGMFIGRTDLAIALGLGPNANHPQIEDCIDRVAESAARHGKVWSTAAESAEHARRMLEKGARLLTHGGDIGMITGGLSRIKESFGPLGFSFRPARS